MPIFAGYLLIAEMKILLAALFLTFVILIGLLPFTLLYLFSDSVRFVLAGVMKYRRRVIVSNLQRAFPQMQEEMREEMLNRFYRHLTDVLIEGIKSISMSPKQIGKRHVLLNPELVESYHRTGKSMIVLAGHYANWEWGSLSASLQTRHDVVAFYKPLSNRHVDRLLKYSRSKFGTRLTSIYQTSQTFAETSGKPTMYLMAADQSPSVRQRDKAIWVDFFNDKTAFLHGPEKHARNHNLDVLYVDIQRVRRGYYTMKLEVLCEDVRTLPEGEITRRYARRLEQAIRNHPPDWLWSHKRWKLNS